MYQEKGFKTIFDDVKAKPIINATINEDEIIKPNKRFSVNNDKFDYSLIVDEYKIPSFNYVNDNSINDFYDYPDVTMSQNPEYKYKYPKLGEGEAIKQQWQTEEGTPNELNRFWRQDQTGESLEDIKQYDDVFQEGLKEIDKMIKETVEQEEEISKKEERPSKKEEVLNSGNKHKRIMKRYNPVTIKPAINTKQINEKANRELNLIDDIKGFGKNLKNVAEEPTNRFKKLNKEIKEGKQLKSISKASQPPIPSKAPDLPSDNLPDLESTLNEAKSKLKHTKTNKEKKEEFDNNKKARYETINRKYNDESKKIVAQENLVLKGYGDVLNKLENITSNKLTEGQRKEINKMLKDIDGSNIGAISIRKTAINRLKTKKELIENKRNEINEKKKAEDKERKGPRTVSRNPSIKQFRSSSADNNSSQNIKT